MNENEVREILDLIDNDNKAEENAAILVEFFKKNNVLKKNYLLVLTERRYDESKCLKAIKSLLSCKVASAGVVGDFGYNFIQNAIYEGYSEKFIIDLIEFSSEFKLNINHRDDDGDTMLHTAIYADEFKGDILEIYKTMIKYGFDSKLVDNQYMNIVEAMRCEKRAHNKFSEDQINSVEEMYNSQTGKKNRGISSIGKVLGLMGYDLSENKKILKKELSKLGVSIDNCLFGLTDELHNELACFAAIKSLINFNVCKVNKKDEFGYNFIQNAMYAGYSTAFINGCIDACDDGLGIYKLDVNNRDEDGDTMLHSAIYCNDKCVLDIASVYETLLKYGFDSSLKDNEGRNIVQAMKYEKKRCNKFSDEQIKKVEEIYNKKMGIGSVGFTKEELDENKKLDKEGLESFLNRCKR